MTPNLDIDDQDDVIQGYASRERAHMQRSLALGMVLIAVNILNIAFMITHIDPGFRQRDLFFLSPPPFLLIPLVISLIVQYHLLRRLGQRFGSMRDSDSSFTDSLYDMVNAVIRLRRWMAAVMVLLALYLLWGASVLLKVSLLDEYPELRVGPMILLIIITLLLACGYIIDQIWAWRRWSRKLRRLENMERAVCEELGIDD